MNKFIQKECKLHYEFKRKIKEIRKNELRERFLPKDALNSTIQVKLTKLQKQRKHPNKKPIILQHLG